MQLLHNTFDGNIKSKATRGKGHKQNHKWPGHSALDGFLEPGNTLLVQLQSKNHLGPRPSPCLAGTEEKERVSHHCGISTAVGGCASTGVGWVTSSSSGTGARSVSFSHVP